MKPGRELDALIAERVMGMKIWRIIDYDGTLDYYPDKDTKNKIPLYSTDIAAAWQVVEKLKENHWFIRLHCHHGDWSVMFDHENEGDDISYASTAPHAICLAALKTLEGK